jgi:hypothetical protein
LGLRQAHDAAAVVSRHRVVEIHLEAPPKPPEGAACNGCGLCCLAEPCPLGMLISRSRHGACRALLWNEGDGRYHCGAVTTPERFLAWLPSGLAHRLARRWIAAGDGCDAGIDMVSPSGHPPIRHAGSRA